MSSEHPGRQQIDEIVLEFETLWDPAKSVQWLAQYYDRCPCDELLAYLVAADCELATKHGQLRDSRYYLPSFTDKLVIIQAALAGDDRDSETAGVGGENQSPNIADTSQFFASLPCMFGKYHVLRCVGRGGMAAVFQAEIDNHTVALKIPYRHHQATSRFSERFQKEIRLLSSLAHPNIIPILDSGQIEGMNYYTMPFIDGEGLNEKCTLERFAALPITSAATYILHAAQALSASHAQSILHRDIKPSNILVDSCDHVWIVDFGLATCTDWQHSITRDGQLLGTPTWMPPEQACGDYSRVDERSDIYSLGATLYSVVTGRAPFIGATTGELLHNIQRRELTPPRHISRRVPVQLQTIILKCMEKSPSQRYASALDLATDLAAFLNGAPIAARSPSLPVRAYRWCRLYPRWTSGALALTCLVLLMVGLVATYRHITNLQQQLIHNAQDQRDAAMLSQRQQQLLLDQIERARRNAIDAANYAEAQQLRTAFNSLDAQIRAGDAGNQSYLNPVPARTSLDSLWLMQQQRRLPTETHAFCTGDWGLYDVAIDHDRKRVATAGRDGNLSIWDTGSGALVKNCRLAERDPDKGFAWNRWRYHVNKTMGFTPSIPLEFTSSVAWTQQGTLLAAGLNGELIEHSLDHDSNSTQHLIFRSPQALHFVRSDSSGQRFLVADELGNCSLLEGSGRVLANAALEMSASWLGHSQLHNAWIFASESGELVYLDEQLREMGRLSTGSAIRDVREQATSASTLLVVSVGQPPSLYDVRPQDSQLQFDLRKRFTRPVDSDQHTYCQALVEQSANKLIAMDESGGITLWDLDNDRSLKLNLGAINDSRHPNAQEVECFDALERRSRRFLLAATTGTLAVDCMGTFREYDFSELSPAPNWTPLASKVGPRVRLAADPKFIGGIWALDSLGYLRYVHLIRDKTLAEVAHAHAGGHADVQVLSDGKLLTAGNDHAVYLWQFQDGEIVRLREFCHTQRLISVAAHEAKQLLASVDEEGSLLVFDLHSGQLRHRFPSSANRSSIASVLTGRVAFSPSGKYLVAFSAGQECTCVDLDRFSLARTSTIKVAGDGGVDVIFSPAAGLDHRFLMSAHSTTCNEVEQDELALSTVNKVIGYPQPAVDFAVTEDQRRIIGLQSDGELAFYSPEHFVQLSTIQGPTRNPSAITLTPGDSSLTVATNDGDLYTWVPEPSLLQISGDRMLDCKFMPIGGRETLAYVRTSSLEGMRSIQDRDGHFAQLFVAGGASTKSQLNRLFLLQKRDQQWSFRPLKFEGDDQGPCEHASLYLTPDQQLCAIVRQGQIALGDYDGRVLLLREADGVWKSEVLQVDGNAGFSPYPIFSSAGALKSVLHFDFEFRRWLMHEHDPVSRNWTRKTFAGNMGFGTFGVRDAKGTTHLITHHMRGLNSQPPHAYVHFFESGEARFEQARGNVPFVNKRGQIFSLDAVEGTLWLRQAENNWGALGKLPLGSVVGVAPTLDTDDQFWLAVCLGSKLLVFKSDMSELSVDRPTIWQDYVGQLDQSLPTSTSCAFNKSRDGVIEILLSQADGALLGIVEARMWSRTPP